MVEENFIHELKHIISSNYSTGYLVDLEQIHLGSVNKSFIVKTAGKIKKKRIFLENTIPVKLKMK